MENEFRLIFYFARGNLVKIRNWPAAVIGNEQHINALVKTGKQC